MHTDFSVLERVWAIKRLKVQILHTSAALPTVPPLGVQARLLSLGSCCLAGCMLRFLGLSSWASSSQFLLVDDSWPVAAIPPLAGSFACGPSGFLCPHNEVAVPMPLPPGPSQGLHSHCGLHSFQRTYSPQPPGPSRAWRDAGPSLTLEAAGGLCLASSNIAQILGEERRQGFLDGGPLQAQPSF